MGGLLTFDDANAELRPSTARGMGGHGNIIGQGGPWGLGPLPPHGDRLPPRGSRPLGRRLPRLSARHGRLLECAHRVRSLGGGPPVLVTSPRGSRHPCDHADRRRSQRLGGGRLQRLDVACRDAGRISRVRALHRASDLARFFRSEGVGPLGVDCGPSRPTAGRHSRRHPPANLPNVSQGWVADVGANCPGLLE